MLEYRELSGETLLSAAIRAFIDNHVEFSAKTAQNYRSQLGKFIRSCGDMPLWRLDERVVRRYFFGSFPGDPNGLREQVLPSTFNYTRMVLRQFFGWLARNNALPAQLIDRTTVPKATAGRTPPVFLTGQQLVAALDSTEHPRDRVLLALLINTGVRESELMRWRIGDVSLDRGKIRVRVSKGGKRDEMPITSDLDAELRRWLRYYTEAVGGLHGRGCLEVDGRGCGQKTRGLPLCAGWYLVPAKSPAKLTRDGLRKFGILRPTAQCSRPADVARRALEAIGVRVSDEDGRSVEGKGTGCHTFRRSAANVLFDHFLHTEGSTDKALVLTQAWLHHTSLQTTQIYLNKYGFVRERDELLVGRSFLPQAEAEPTRLAVAE